MKLSGKTVLGLCIAAGLLAGCGGKSPRDTWLKKCEGTKETCSCMADALEKNISEDEFAQLNEIMEKRGFFPLITAKPKASDKMQELTTAVQKGELVSQRVSRIFLQNSKACASGG